ncbi:MAG: capsular biosynthesis protein, partial [Bacilli bacterium]|nr:capsular biosynthesis protein [Bacilli bacterium]
DLLPLHSAYISKGFNIDDFPNAYNLFRNEITLPLHTKLTNEDIEYVLDIFNQVYCDMKDLK